MWMTWMGVQIRLWHCWETTQQRLEEVTEVQSHSSGTPAGGMIPLPDAPPMDVGPRNVLSLIGHTKFGKEGPNMPLPMGKGGPPASIMGKLPHLLSKTQQRSWQISDLEFQNTLQIAKAVCPTNQMGKQHAIISHMAKHKKQQSQAKSTLIHNTERYHERTCRHNASLDSKQIHMPTSCEAVAWWHAKSTQHRFLHLDEKDFTQGRCSHLQTTVLASICSVRMVQHSHQCWVQQRQQHEWVHAYLCT